MNLLTIFTGGTIGSYKNNGVISLKEKRPILIEKYQEKYGDGVNFIIEEPYTCFSEDMSLKHYHLLLEVIKKAPLKELDGIIITHGTDTLGYSANILGMLLGNASIPVVLVSSNYGLEDDRANGFKNFEDAVNFIREGIPGVFVCFFQDNISYVHLATRVLQSPHFLDRFYSVGGCYFGTMEEGGFCYHKDSRNVAIEALKGAPSYVEESTLEQVDKNVLMLPSYVGCDYDHISIGKTSGAVMIETYHSGTLCNSESFHRLLERCKEKKVPVFVGPISKEHNEIPYDTTASIKEQQVTYYIGQSKEAFYAKLVVLMQQKQGEELKQAVEKERYFEVI